MYYCIKLLKIILKMSEMQDYSDYDWNEEEPPPEPPPPYIGWKALSYLIDMSANPEEKKLMHQKLCNIIGSKNMKRFFRILKFESFYNFLWRNEI